MAKLKQYHFSLGNSTDGPIGFCALIEAESEKQAVSILQEALPEELAVESSNGGVIYIEVYFNSAKVSAKDIDEVERVSEFGKERNQ